MNEVYKQLIDDYIEISEKHLGFTFGRIMSFIFRRLAKKDKNLYLQIRKRITLERLDALLSKDWVHGSFLISNRLIKLAKRWKEDEERK